MTKAQIEAADEMWGEVERLTNYLGSIMKAFKDGRGYLDMTAIPGLCKDAKNAADRYIEVTEPPRRLK